MYLSQKIALFLLVVVLIFLICDACRDIFRIFSKVFWLFSGLYPLQVKQELPYFDFLMNSSSFEQILSRVKATAF